MESISRYFTPPADHFFLLGPRGTGKTWLTQRLFPQALRIDLLEPETLRSLSARPERLRELIGARPDVTQVVIDEVQKLPVLLEVVHLMIEEKRGVQFIFTGSSARKLRRGGVNLLGGRAALNLSYDEEPMPDINPDTLDVRVASGLFAGLRDWNESTAETLNLVIRHQGRMVPTVGGFLLFGTMRERFFPDAWIQCGRFRGTGKTAILDQQDVRDHLPLALEKAFEFVKKHASRAAEFGELRRKDVWNIPLEAVREALTNAVVHADYSQIGAPIRVAVFDDRIEIENPGLLTGGLTIDNLRSGLSKLRNRVIGRVFKELNLIEQWGSGFQRMQASCTQGGFPDPEFEELGYHFRVTFSLQRQNIVAENPVDMQILDFLARYEGQGGASVKELAEATGLVDRSVRRRLARLIKAGQIVAVGKSAYDPHKRYLPAKEPKA